MSRDALVVGINTYTYAHLRDLQAPSEDAEAIAQLLEKYGDFKVTRLPAIKDKQHQTIRVGRKTKVTLTQLEEKIVQLFKPEGKQVPDTALLYFSGHGLRKNRGIQEGFLATSDVNPDGGNWGLSLQWLRRLLQESEVRQQIIILDCCYGGEVLNFAEADPGERGKGRDRCFMAASRQFEVAYEGIATEHSAFTAILLAGLEPKQERWVTNLTIADFLNQADCPFPQRPTCNNSGTPINLTRRWTAAVEESVPSVKQEICPYKGLAYFECNEEDPKYFYGREVLTDELLDKVRQSNFLAILGASGSGKSSVLRAGLLHQLKLGRRLSGSNEWEIKILTPGEHPLQSLALAFLDSELSAIERAAQLKQAEELLVEGATGLRRLVQATDAGCLVLVIDQFEEAFTLCQDEGEREKFFECLLGVNSAPQPPNVGYDAHTSLYQHQYPASSPPNPPNLGGTKPFKVSKSPRIGGFRGLKDSKLEPKDLFCLRIILAMRADFFGKCVEREYSGLAQRIQQNLVTVTPMQQEELRLAIVEPAKRVELKVEPELVRQMLADVAGSPGSLPLLQYTLLELWNRRRDNCLQLATYSQLGGVMGTLQKRATEVYEQFSEEEKAAAKHIFLSLTQLGEGTEDTRRRVLKEDLVTSRHSERLIDRVVQKLADARLIVTHNPKSKILNPKSVVVDVAHEALIRHWILLREWLNESRDNLREKRKIEAAAQEWRNRGKAKDYLLQGRRLREAKEFQKEQVDGFALSKLAEEFIEASVKQKQINRFRFIAGFLIIPLIGTGLVGFGIYREITIQRYRKVLIATKGSEYSEERIDSVQKLAWLREPLNKGLLIKANLNQAYLYRVNLRGADLQTAFLRGAYLIKANLREANLREADLRVAFLIEANLYRANLIKANLYVAQLSETNLEKADLRGANLNQANLNQANLNQANLYRANLKGAKLQRAELYVAQLSETNLEKADLRGANLKGANLKGGNLNQANLKGAINLIPAQVKAGCNWQEAIYSDEFRQELDSSPEPKEKPDCSWWEK